MVRTALLSKASAPKGFDSSEYDGEVAFGILAFQSPGDARATYKALVTEERGKAEKDGKKGEAFVEKPNYNDLAKLRIDRLKKTAQGTNPDV
ncbi:hypothetical protein AMK26_10885 [Streptomyces sp. CB03234]|uniref:hypothetical protein n=1 Tax=Streptomyces sp. (strain CB03234) TaxID=1703937 RepID=UPI00093DFA8B|nr:hypothetical protein [Streptomyces sp. CB03234]OKK06508.1 hypothetical protein AMK26_10885 [Streptomyces sp. CB03234]